MASESTEQRKLAAIMFTDMVGYSALAQRDDKLALELLEEHRQLLREIFPRFNGSEIKTIGDAFLIEFNSALEAAQCAIEIQRALAKRNPDVSAGRRIELRIGIHIGDVVHRGGDVYGDGVNIASRIERLAGPGGICVSMDVERQIRNALEARFERLAPTELKNISVAMDLFCIVLPWEQQGRVATKSGAASPSKPTTGQTGRRIVGLTVVVAIIVVGLLVFELVARDRRARRKDEATTESGRPPAAAGSLPIAEKSIAVLPFENLSDDKSNAYFANGIQDEILTRLSKIADLKVISRTSTQRFKSTQSDLREIAVKLGVANILEGSVQKSGDAVRVTVQLIQAANDSHLWAETYDRKLIDVFGVESDIAQKIASSLEAKLTGREKEAIASVGTKNAQAYEFYLRGLSQRNKSSESDTRKRIENYRRAVELDPNYADAWAQLAIEQAFIYRSPEQSEELGNNARVAAENALRLASDSAQAHQAMGLYYGNCRDQYEAALRELEIAHERAPNDGAILGELGLFQRSNGKVDEAVATMQKAAELDPLNLEVWKILASTYRGLRRFADARAVLERALALEPNDMDVIGGIAVNYQAEGNLDAAWKILSPYPFQTPQEWAFVPYTDQYLLWRDYGFLIETIKGMNLGGGDYPPIITAANDVFLANLYFLNQQRDLAVSHAQKAEREMKELREKKIILYELSANYIQMTARAGNRAEMQREIDYIFAKMGDNKWLLPAAESWAAAGYALLGDLDKALSLLQDSLSKPNGITVANLRLDPAWDRARNDPRFQKLCQEKEP